MEKKLIEFERVTEGYTKKGDYEIYNSSLGFRFSVVISRGKQLFVDSSGEIWLDDEPCEQVYMEDNLYGKTYRWKQVD